MSDAVKRAVRTFFQAFIGAFLATGFLSGVADVGSIDWSAATTAAVSAVAAGVIAVLSFVQNALEDNTSFPTVLKE